MTTSPFVSAAALLLLLLGSSACSSEPDRWEVRSQPRNGDEPPPGTGELEIDMTGGWRIVFSEPLTPRIGNVDVPQPVGLRIQDDAVTALAMRFGTSDVTVYPIDRVDTVRVNQADGRILLLSLTTAIDGDGELRFDLVAGTTPDGLGMQAFLDLRADLPTSGLRIESDVTLSRIGVFGSIAGDTADGASADDAHPDPSRPDGIAGAQAVDVPARGSSSAQRR